MSPRSPLPSLTGRVKTGGPYPAINRWAIIASSLTGRLAGADLRIIRMSQKTGVVQKGVAKVWRNQHLPRARPSEAGCCCPHPTVSAYSESCYHSYRRLTGICSRETVSRVLPGFEPRPLSRCKARRPRPGDTLQLFYEKSVSISPAPGLPRQESFTVRKCKAPQSEPTPAHYATIAWTSSAVQS